MSLNVRDALKRAAMKRATEPGTEEIHDREFGLLTTKGLDRILDAELARAARHGRAVSLIYMEVSGRAVEPESGNTHLPEAIARALITGVRTEDHAARLGRTTFAVLAVETSESGTVAGRVATRVKDRLLSLGVPSDSFSVAVGWTDCQYDEVSREQLIRQAEEALAAAILTNEGITFPPEAENPPATIIHFHGAQQG
jgi:PleD family two-component response regulator